MRRTFAAVVSGLLGFALGAALAFAFRAAMRPAVGVALAAAVGMVVSTCVRKPPQRHDFALETVWRALLGLLCGALAGLAAYHWLADVPLPLALPPLSADTRLVEHPAVLGTGVGLVLGLLFGIAESAPSAPKSPSPAAAPPAAKAG